MFGILKTVGVLSDLIGVLSLFEWGYFHSCLKLSKKHIFSFFSGFVWNYFKYRTGEQVYYKAPTIKFIVDISQLSGDLQVHYVGLRTHDLLLKLYT